jgi:hypothetical protein
MIEIGYNAFVDRGYSGDKQAPSQLPFRGVSYG